MYLRNWLDETSAKIDRTETKSTFEHRKDRDADCLTLNGGHFLLVFVNFRFAHIAEQMDKFYWIRIIVFVKFLLIPNELVFVSAVSLYTLL